MIKNVIEGLMLCKGGNINNIENNQEKIEQMEISFNITIYKGGRYTYVVRKE